MSSRTKRSEDPGPGAGYDKSLSVIPGLVPGIHVLNPLENVDGRPRIKSGDGHDEDYSKSDLGFRHAAPR
jgi:hypothetical protein